MMKAFTKAISLIDDDKIIRKVEGRWDWRLGTLLEKVVEVNGFPLTVRRGKGATPR